MTLSEFDSKLKALLKVLWHVILIITLLAIVGGVCYNVIAAIMHF